MNRDGPDPLGKRALFWMPVEPTAQSTAESMVQPTTRPAARPQRPKGLTEQPVGDGQTYGSRRGRPAGKHALYSTATAEPGDGTAPARSSDDPRPEQGLFTVTCSACGVVTRIGLLDLLILQFPVGIWLPGRTFDHRMTCPACKRRTWLSVTLFPRVP